MACRCCRSANNNNGQLARSTSQMVGRRREQGGGGWGETQPEADQCRTEGGPPESGWAAVRGSGGWQGISARTPHPGTARPSTPQIGWRCPLAWSTQAGPLPPVAQHQMLCQLLQLNGSALWRGPLRLAPCHLHPQIVSYQLSYHKETICSTCFCLIRGDLIRSQWQATDGRPSLTQHSHVVEQGVASLAEQLKNMHKRCLPQLPPLSPCGWKHSPNLESFPQPLIAGSHSTLWWRMPDAPDGCRLC